MGLRNIPIPEDFYDGEARKAQVNSLLFPGTVGLASVDNEDGTATVAIAVKDQKGAGMRAFADVWLSDTAFGGVDSQTANMTKESGDTAVVVETVTANDHLRVALPATGIGTLTLTGADTGHVVAAVGGVLRSAAFTVTGP